MDEEEVIQQFVKMMTLIKNQQDNMNLLHESHKRIEQTMLQQQERMQILEERLEQLQLQNQRIG